MSRARSILAVLAVATCGCGAQAFEHDFRERAEPEITRVLRALEEVPATDPGAADPLVVAVRDAPRGLRAISLADGQVRWDVDADVRTSPLLAGPFVVVTEGDVIVGRRAANGERVFEAGRGRLLGAHSDGTRVVVSIAEGPEQSPRGRIVLATEDGAQFEHELSLPVGVAAVANELVIVPWATQRLSFLNAADGVERARLRFPSRVVGRAWTSAGRVLVGQHDVLRVGPPMEDVASAEAWQPLGRPLPGQPPIIPDGYAPVPEPSGAQNRVRLVWSAAPGDTLGARDGLLYLVFYRLVFALAADADEARWVHVHESDVVGATAVEGGLWIVDERGNAKLLGSRDGQPVLERSLGGAMLAAALRAGPAPAATEGSSANEATPLPEQLLAAARVNDNRLGGGRALAARLLGTFEGDAITGHLVTLCADRASPEPARQAACVALTTRREGQPHVRAALTHHGSFLADRPSPPVGPLARAAASMSMRNAAPTLLRHLDDPGTPAAELEDLVTGIGALGVPSAAPRLEAFVRLYHASDEPELVRAVIAGTLAVETIDARRGAALRQAVLDDPFTPAAVRTGLERAIAERAAAAAREEEPAPPPSPEPTPEPADTRPERIDARITASVFRPVQRQLQRCLEGEVRAARISMVVNGQGEIGTIAVTPSEAQSCVEAIVRRLSFPATRLGLREQVVHQVRR